MNIHQQATGSISGMARRWLKAQFSIHGDPNRANHERQDADAIEHVLRDRAQDELDRALAGSLLLQRWKETLQTLDSHRDLLAADREAERQQVLLDRPRATTSMIVRGALQGKVDGEFAARISWPDEDGIFAVIEIEAIEPSSIGNVPFHGLRLAVPAGDALLGKPINLGKAVERHWRYWDPLDAQICLGSYDDAFYWSSDYGSAHIWPEPGLTAMQLIMPAENLNGQRISIDGTIRFEAGTRLDA